MNTRGQPVSRLAMLVLLFAPIAHGGCDNPPGSGPALPGEARGSVAQADTSADPPVATDVDPAPLFQDFNCEIVANYTVDTGHLFSTDIYDFPDSEAGQCTDPFTISDPGDGASGGDAYGLGEAWEICKATAGASQHVMGYFTEVTATGDFPTCEQYGTGSDATRRWVSYFGCCAAQTPVPTRTVPLTRTHRDCSGALVDTALTPQFGFARVRVNASNQLVATVVLKGAEASTVYTVKLIQTPPAAGNTTCAVDPSIPTITTDIAGNASITVRKPLLSTTTDAFVEIDKQSDLTSAFTSDEVFF